MTKKNNLEGQVFGWLRVIEDGGRDSHQNILWSCQCRCGNIVRSTAYDLKNGRVTSCKCRPKSIKHGMAKKGKKRAPIYSVWAAMIQRCTNPKDKKYADYGGRGITIDPSWLSFEVFLSEVGDVPFTGASIDRKDNNKGYTKDNVKWVTHKQQMRNTRRNIHLTYNGQTKILAEWCREFNVANGMFYYHKKYNGVAYEETLRRLHDRRGQN